MTPASTAADFNDVPGARRPDDEKPAQARVGDPPRVSPCRSGNIQRQPAVDGIDFRAGKGSLGHTDDRIALSINQHRGTNHCGILTERIGPEPVTDHGGWLQTIGVVRSRPDAGRTCRTLK